MFIHSQILRLTTTLKNFLLLNYTFIKLRSPTQVLSANIFSCNGSKKMLNKKLYLNWRIWNNLIIKKKQKKLLSITQGIKLIQGILFLLKDILSFQQWNFFMEMTLMLKIKKISLIITSTSICLKRVSFNTKKPLNPIDF